MKQLNKSHLNELGRIEEQGWDVIKVIFQNAIEIDLDEAMRSDITTEQRTHACGKLLALKDMFALLESERKDALVRIGRISEQ